MAYMAQPEKVTSVSIQSVDEIYDAFISNHLIQCAFKSRLSQLNIKKATIDGTGITPEDRKTFLANWVHPLIFDIARMLCMFGAIQFKITKEKSNKKIKTEDGTEKNVYTFTPKVGLFNKNIKVCERDGATCLYVDKGDDDNKDAIFMIRDSYSVGVDPNTGKICSEVGLVLPLLQNVHHMEKIHRQVRVDLALPPVVIQQERQTDFQRGINMRAEQLLTDNEANKTVNPQGKIVSKPTSSKPTTFLLKPDEIIESMKPPSKQQNIKTLFGIEIDKEEEKQFLTIQNQHFLGDGLIVSGNVPEPKIIFNLIQEKAALQIEINRIFNIHDGNETPLSQQRALVSYKSQLETALKELWIAVNDTDEDDDIVVNIPLDFKENI